MITLCAWCKRFRNEKGHWEKLREEHREAKYTHGICPDCLREQNPDLYEEMLKNSGEDE